MFISKSDMSTLVELRYCIHVKFYVQRWPITESDWMDACFISMRVHMLLLTRDKRHELRANDAVLSCDVGTEHV